jgi:hypothetical protein
VRLLARHEPGALGRSRHVRADQAIEQVQRQRLPTRDHFEGITDVVRCRVQARGDHFRQARGDRQAAGPSPEPGLLAQRAGLGTGLQQLP